MIENPFLITERIIPKYFCDREEESAEVIKLITNRNNVVLISPRRMGKTGLIQYCFEQERIKSEYIAIYVDILSTTNLKEFTFLLGQEIFQAVRSKGERLWRNFLTIVKSLAGKIGFDPVSGLPSLNLQLGDIVKPEYTLKEIFDYISATEKVCLLAIDEFQQISRYPEQNIEALLRRHILQTNNCRFIFSGSERHILEKMFLNSSRPFYMSSSIMELKAIPQDVYVAFICRMFEEAGKKISADLARHVYETFDGVTFYIQRVCNGMFANTGQNGESTAETFSDTLDGILYSFDLIYRMRMSHLSTRQKELLIAVAKEKCVDKITSVEFVQRHSLASPGAVQTSLKSLLKNDYVVKGENGYSVDDIFFRLWINKNFS